MSSDVALYHKRVFLSNKNTPKCLTPGRYLKGYAACISLASQMLPTCWLSARSKLFCVPKR